jgi:starch phosphorylase
MTDDPMKPAGGTVSREEAPPPPTAETLKSSILDHLLHRQAHSPEGATRNDWYLSVAYAVRDRLLERWIRSVQRLVRDDARIVSYLSAEFLMGPHLGNNLLNLGLDAPMRQAVRSLGLEMSEILAQEEEPGLGNGGLGRLAACFLDSLTTLEVPAIGYGIRYEFGIFDQEIRDGQQVEVADQWLQMGNPWEIARPESRVIVKVGGHTETWTGPRGEVRTRWTPANTIAGVAYDTPISGYGVDHANLLRLWKSEAVQEFNLQAFNAGDYVGAVHDKMVSETISKVLYPNDDSMQGKRLRLIQQYFFVSCALQDMFRIHRGLGRPPETFHEKFAIQLNDTHPSIGVAELMRLLLDEHGLEWAAAWDITRRTFGYTNHTLLPEALERWSLPLFRAELPRHVEIIQEIDRRMAEAVRLRFPGDEARVERMAILDPHGDGTVRMANLASFGSHAINGVAALHTELLGRDVLRDFHEMDPDRFVSITNGVTPRRFVALSNPGLAALISELTDGDGWLRDSERALPALERVADDAGFQERWRKVKRQNKEHLAEFIRGTAGILVDPDSLFDVQCKRFHEYKRQHLNALHIVALYNRLRNNSGPEAAPRTVLFAGKAAPGYFMAKLVIRLINAIGEVVNSDPRVRDRLRVAFVPDFNVQVAQRLYPAGDLSEQISTAGKEASGTGNMKFALNGALTIGTLDGANIEIRERVGAENFFLFGHTADEVRALREQGYEPQRFYDADPELREAVDMIASGSFSRGDRETFRPLVESLMGRDEYLLFADFPSYMECQTEAGQAYAAGRSWTRMSILNVARSGWFSSDRSIREYCAKIWRVTPGAARSPQP